MTARSRLRIRGDRGFSLVEVLCAILVLGVGLVGITEGITIALQASKDSERGTVAALLAAGRMEELRAEGYFSAGEETGDFGDDFPLYAWRQEIASTSIEGLYEVTVTVELAESEEDLYELKTLLFDMPLTLRSRTTEDSKSSLPGGSSKSADPRLRQRLEGRRGL